MAAVRTTCAYCGVGCGIAADVTGARTVAIKGDPAHPANHGRLCSKGTHLGETVGLEGRLLHPMIGETRASWDEALDLTAQRLRETIARHGPDSVAFYVSGQLLTEDYYVANKLMKGFIGSANIDTNSRLCMASAVAAHVRAFGEDIVPCAYADLDNAELIVLVGSNTAWCHPVVWQRIEAARAAHGTRIVVIDPRRTETAALADLHIPVDPDGDVTLFTALLAEMDSRGLAVGEVEFAGGFRQSLNRDPGIDPALFGQLAELVARHPRMVTVYSMGVNQSVCGTDKANAIINFHLATGRISQLGAGPFSITGQPNAMGGREVGGLANALACHLGFSEAEQTDVAAYWQTDRLCEGPGLKAVDMFRAIHDGRIKFLWVMATNPAVSLPDSGFVREALARCETVVVSDVIAGTDTAKFAHVRLPALAWGEKDGTVTNSERCISRQRAIFPAPGEARPDWWIINQIAARLGWAAAFAHGSPAAIWREYAGMTALGRRHGKVLDLVDKSELTDAQYEAMEPFQWGGRHPLAHRPASLVAVNSPVAVQRNPEFPLTLNTGRYRDQWHTMTRTGLSPTLSRHRREPCLEVNPADAAACSLAEGGLARVHSECGTATFRVMITADQRPGEVFAPMHWSDAMAGEAGANRLPGQRIDTISGQPGFKRTPVRVDAVSPEWRAFLVSAVEVAPGTFTGLAWWTRARVDGGWLYELAGMVSPDVDAFLPGGERLEANDLGRGMRRMAVRASDGTLLAAFYLTRRGELPAREWIAGRLGLASPGAEWLSGRPGTPAPDRGPLVCLCNGAHAAEIAAAAAAGAATVQAVGSATRAGTNCGSCRPAIARLLAACLTREQEAAE